MSVICQKCGSTNIKEYKVNGTFQYFCSDCEETPMEFYDYIEQISNHTKKLDESKYWIYFSISTLGVILSPFIYLFVMSFWNGTFPEGGGNFSIYWAFIPPGLSFVIFAGIYIYSALKLNRPKLVIPIIIIAFLTFAICIFAMMLILTLCWLWGIIILIEYSVIKEIVERNNRKNNPYGYFPPPPNH